MAPRVRPRDREREIVDATRALFDAEGVQEARVAHIARAVGINKAIIYRHFSSKEELFVHTVSSYLDDLDALLGEVDAQNLAPEEALRAMTERYTGFCLEFPAFLDCALSLMRRPFVELADAVGDAVLFRLGQAMAACLGRVAGAYAREGVFAVDDPDRAANHLYTQALGTMHLARVRVAVRRGPGGTPQTYAVDPEEVRRACVEDALAHARGCYAGAGRGLAR
jgi:AcrR family transcriptional regulator